MTAPTAEEIFAIDHVLNEYIWGIDTKDMERLVGTFWDDGALHTRRDDGTARVLTAEALRADPAAFFTGHDTYRHIESNRIYLAEGEDRVRVPGYWIACSVDPTIHGASIVSAGESENLMERRAGQWRILRRDIRRWTRSRITS